MNVRKTEYIDLPFPIRGTNLRTKICLTQSIYTMKRLITLLFLVTCYCSVNAQNCSKLNERAALNIQKGNYDSVTLYVNQVLAEDSSCFIAYYYRGMLAYVSNKPKLAYDDFSKVVRLDPTYQGAWFALGLIESDEEAYTSAAACFEKCIQLDSTFHQAIFQLGKAQFYGKLFDEALVNFNLAISLYDLDSEYFEYRGMLNYMKGFKEAGCLDLEKAQSLGNISDTAIGFRDKECK
jgi:tetratricopeptide (TPR) repeat protein